MSPISISASISCIYQITVDHGSSMLWCGIDVLCRAMPSSPHLSLAIVIVTRPGLGQFELFTAILNQVPGPAASKPLDHYTIIQPVHHQTFRHCEMQK